MSDANVADERGMRKKLDVVRLVKIYYANSGTSTTIVLLVLSFCIPLVLGSGYALWHQGAVQRAAQYWQHIHAPAQNFSYEALERQFETLDSVHRAAQYMSSDERRYLLRIES